MIEEESNVVRLRFTTLKEAQENERAILKEFGEKWEGAFKVYDDTMAKLASERDALAKSGRVDVPPLFIQIARIDIGKRVAYGSASIDQWQKLNLEKWSEDIASASNYKSKGNVRAMDGKIAAGKLVDISFDDKRGAIDIAAKIVDAEEWRKVEDGVYTGLMTSPAGAYLVDAPLAPGATFAVAKTDGGNDLRKFAGQSEWRRQLSSLQADTASLRANIAVLKESNSQMRAALAVEKAKQDAVLSLKSSLDTAVKTRDERLYGATAIAKRSLRFARANPIAFYGQSE